MKCVVCSWRGSVGTYVPDPRRPSQTTVTRTRKIGLSDMVWACWKCHEVARQVMLATLDPPDQEPPAVPDGFNDEVDRVLVSMVALALIG